MEVYPLVICYIAIEYGHRNSRFSHKKIVIFHSYVNVYQRVLMCLEAAELTKVQWEFQDSKMELRKRTIFWAIFCGDIP